MYNSADLRSKESRWDAPKSEYSRFETVPLWPPPGPARREPSAFWGKLAQALTFVVLLPTMFLAALLASVVIVSPVVLLASFTPYPQFFWTLSVVFIMAVAVWGVITAGLSVWDFALRPLWEKFRD
jgi:hypothetical protein